MFGQVQKIVANASEYITSIEEMLKGIDMEMYTKLMSSIALLKGTVEVTVPKKLSLEEAYKLFSNIHDIHEALEYVSNIVDRYDNISRGMSETFMDEFTGKRRVIINAITMEIGNSADERTDGFSNIDLGVLCDNSSDCKDKVKPNELVTKLVSLDKEMRKAGRNARELFVYIANKIIGKLGYHNHAILQEYIESLKNELLNTSELSGYLLKGLLSDFTILPDVPSIAMKEAEIMLPVIKKIIPSPIEFNTRYLTDFEFSTKNKVMTGPLRGVSTEVLVRFNTIKALDDSGVTTDLSIPKEVIEGTKHKAVEAYETLDGKTYRKVLINNGATKHRLHAYNNILDLALNDYIGDVESRVKLNLEEFDIVSSEYQRGIRKRMPDIKRGIITESKKILKADFDENAPKNGGELKEIIISGYYIIPALSKSLYQLAVNTVEARLSQLEHLNGLASELERNIKSMYDQSHLPTGMFRDYSGEDLVNQMVEHAYVVIQRAVNEFDANKFSRAYVTLKGWGMEKFIKLDSTSDEFREEGRVGSSPHYPAAYG
jgi:hypothetical protein